MEATIQLYLLSVAVSNDNRLLAEHHWLCSKHRLGHYNSLSGRSNTHVHREIK